MRDSVYLTFSEFEALRSKVDSTIDAYMSEVSLPFFELHISKSQCENDDSHFVLFDYKNGDLLISEYTNYVHTDFGGFGNLIYSIKYKKKAISSGFSFEPTYKIACNKEIENNLDEFTPFVNDAFWIIQGAFEVYGNSIFDVDIKKAKKSENHHKNSKQKNVVRLYKSYKLKKDWDVKRKKSKHEITCKCWGVRGHYRHYKSGKVVFVRPYAKGKDKKLYSGKEYRFLPKQVGIKKNEPNG